MIAILLSTLMSGSHAGQFIHIFETVFKDTLGHRTGSLRNAKHNCHLWLHVCRKSRIRKRCHLCVAQRLRSETTRTASSNSSTSQPASIKLGGRRFQMLRDYILYRSHRPLVAAAANMKGTCLDLIRNNRILCLMQLLHTDDTDHIRSGATDICAHAV